MSEASAAIGPRAAQRKVQRMITGLDTGRRFLVAGVLVLTFFAFVETLRYEFVYDDVEQIVGNTGVHSWHNVPRYFTEHVWIDVYPGSTGNYYRPVFLLWLLVNYTLFGPNPFGWHLATVLAHLLVTALVYVLAGKLLKDPVTAFIACLIFGLSPVHIESVAWASGITDPLLAIFFIPSFLCYMNYRERQNNETRRLNIWPVGNIWLVGSLIFYALALLAKETAVILPAIILAYEFINRDRSVRATGLNDHSKQGPFGPDAPQSTTQAELKLKRFLIFTWRTILKLIPFAALTAVYMVVRILALRGFGHEMTPLPFSTIVFTWPSLLWFYARQLIWPFNLSVFYDLPYVKSPGLSNFALPLMGLAALAIGLWWLKRSESERNRRALALAAFWLALPILPVLNLPGFIEGEVAHDRYLYLPSIGFALIFAVLLRKIRFNRGTLFRQPALQVVSVILVALAFTVGIINQQVYWASDLLLYHHGIKFAPNNKLAITNLGNAVSKRGMYNEALVLFQRLYEIDPNYWAASYNLGYNHYRLGNYTEAERHLVRGIELLPLNAEQYLTLAITLFEMGRYGEAERSIRIAITLKPAGYGFHYTLGAILKEQGNLKAALDEFKLENDYNPQYGGTTDQIMDIESRL
jgi:protein O-mannosyl-transferase